MKLNFSVSVILTSSMRTRILTHQVPSLTHWAMNEELETQRRMPLLTSQKVVVIECLMLCREIPMVKDNLTDLKRMTRSQKGVRF